jgi:hypothetical protein
MTSRHFDIETIDLSLAQRDATDIHEPNEARA